MNIALCIFGLPRGNKSCWKSISKNLSKNLNSDMFIHTWDLKEKHKNWHGSPESNNNLYNMLSFFKNKNKNNLKLSKIEAQNSFTPKIIEYKGDKVFYSNQCNMWLSVVNVLDSMLYYENKTGIKYDVVVLTRSDLMFSKSISIENISSFIDNNGSEILHSGIFNKDGQVNAEDLFMIVKRSEIEKFKLILEKTKQKYYLLKGIHSPLEHEFVCNSSNIKYKESFSIFRESSFLNNRYVNYIKRQYNGQ